MGVKILGVSGSLREGSYSARVTRMTMEIARDYDAETRLLDLRLAALPMFQPDVSDNSATLAEASDAVNWADAFVLASPDYHGSMSGAMKNFLDFFWEEFAGKVFGYLCSSHEKGLTVMDQMRTAVRQCYGWSLPYGVSFNGDVDFDRSGKIINSALARRLGMLARDLAIYGALIRQQFKSDLEGDVTDTFAARFRK